MKSEAENYSARARLLGGNRMKLGVMAFNCSHGSKITKVPEAWKLDWADTVEIAQMVDRAGMETLLADYLGATRVIWLGEGVPHDETGGHIDNLACFVQPGMVLLSWCDDPADPLSLATR